MYRSRRRLVRGHNKRDTPDYEASLLFFQILLFTHLAAPAHAAGHLLAPCHHGDDESNDGKRAGRGTKLNREASRIRADNHVCLIHPEERGNGDEKEKGADDPLCGRATRPTTTGLLLAEESHR